MMYMKEPGSTRQLGEAVEAFITSEEGAKWLEWHGWVRASKVIEKAMIVPLDSEDILEEAVVMVLGSGEVSKSSSSENGFEEMGILGKVALVDPRLA